MEWKIGEIRQINGEWYQCVVAIDGCRECSFRTQDYCTIHSECMSLFRRDGRSVIFKKLEKVGKPYEYFIQGMGIRMVQEYIITNTNYIWEYSQDVVVMDCQNGKIAIEVKQAKEDMPNTEDKKETKSLKSSNFKPFNLEAVKTGKPVCTRDGRKARIVCFDRKHRLYPIIALLENEKGNEEYISTYMKDGSVNPFQPHPSDLMMKED